jgi:hypothetical protein
MLRSNCFLSMPVNLWLFNLHFDSLEQDESKSEIFELFSKSCVANNTNYLDYILSHVHNADTVKK